MVKILRGNTLATHDIVDIAELDEAWVAPLRDGIQNFAGVLENLVQ